MGAFWGGRGAAGAVLRIVAQEWGRFGLNRPSQGVKAEIYPLSARCATNNLGHDTFASKLRHPIESPAIAHRPCKAEGCVYWIRMLAPQTPVIATLNDLTTILAPGNEALIHAGICTGSFDRIIPGMRATDGCSHGTKIHLEGDVARHTAKVVSNLVRSSTHDLAIHFDGIDLLAALMHDVEKPATRWEDNFGHVHFSGHEARAADRVPEVAHRLGLDEEQQRKLDFLVREHGVAHSLPIEEREVQERIVSSAYWRNLRLLQRADAISCYFNADGSAHAPVHWELFDGLQTAYRPLSPNS
jgi:hypothetical protein